MREIHVNVRPQTDYIQIRFAHVYAHVSSYHHNEAPRINLDSSILVNHAFCLDTERHLEYK